MILIIGAGISGLSVANYLNQSKYIIIEKEPEAGGYCRTIKKDGFVWDYSGHFFHFRDINIKEYLLSRMNRYDIIEVEKRSQIYYKGTYIDFPFQKNIHQLSKNEFLECILDLYFRENNDGNNFKEMLMANYGKAICEKFLFPYNEKLYACNLNDLDVNAMGRFFPSASFDQIMKNIKYPHNDSYNSRFTYPKGGAIEYVNALLKDIEQKKISFNETIERIDVQKKIAYTNKREIRYSSLVSTIPFDKLMDVCDIEYNRETYTYNKVLVFNIGFEKKGHNNNHWIYYPEKQYVFYRVGFYDNIFDDNRMSIYVEIGLKAFEEYNETKVFNTVINDLKRVGIIEDNKIVAASSLLLKPAYIHINSKAQKDFYIKNEYLNMNNIFSIGRYGGWKYCSIEDNIMEARDLVSKGVLV